MPIEQLQTTLWTTQDVDLQGNLTGTETKRVVCSYFPPHVEFSQKFLDSADPKYLKVTNSGSFPIEIGTNDGPFHSDTVVEITLANGGAMYLLGEADEADIREGWLWKLLPGLEASNG